MQRIEKMGKDRERESEAKQKSGERELDGERSKGERREGMKIQIDNREDGETEI